MEAREVCGFLNPLVYQVCAFRPRHLDDRCFEVVSCTESWSCPECRPIFLDVRLVSYPRWGVGIKGMEYWIINTKVKGLESVTHPEYFWL